MSLRDIQTIHVTNMLARDSVILLLSAIKMVNTDLFTSSLVHFRRPVKPKKCFMLSRIVMFVNRAGIFRAVMKSPKLIFISLKRRTFPLITSVISSDSELYIPHRKNVS